MTLQEERTRRYSEKIELAGERIQNIRDWHLGGKDLKTRLAMYKAFQEAAEAAMDLCAMMCSDSGKTIKDDYGNIESLESAMAIDAKLATSMKEMNGMRNRVVHEYNGFSYEIFSRNVERLLGEAEKFISVVESWMRKK